MEPEQRSSHGVTHDVKKGGGASGPRADAPIAVLAGRPLLSNRGTPLNLDWVKQVRVNTSAVERRAQTHVARRTVKKEWQAAWLLRAITCMDLTTLSGDDTDERVRRLCAKARQPLQQELVKRLGIEELGMKVAAVCVYHRFVETAVRALEGSGIHVAAVSTGFPAGLSPLEERVAEIRRSVGSGRKRDRHRHHTRPRIRRTMAGTLRRGCRVQAGLRRGTYESDPRDRRSADSAQCGARQLRGYDGGCGLHQDINRERNDQRHTACGICDDAGYPGICAGDRHGGRVQAGGRNSYSKTIARSGWR